MGQRLQRFQGRSIKGGVDGAVAMRALGRFIEATLVRAPTGVAPRLGGASQVPDEGEGVGRAHIRL